jgi:hypothetical protein
MQPIRRLLIAVACFAALLAVTPGTASAATCWKELVNDYWADNRVDRVYPISCYREAMAKLPRDVQEYSDAQDDLRRALLAAIRDERDNGSFEDDFGSAAGEDAVGSSGGDDGGPSGFIGEVLSKLGPKNADSIPVPLLVLGSLALLLVGAAGVSAGMKYLQARRLPPGDAA